MDDRSATPLPDRDRITIAILALGGEGGGVLSEWIQHVARLAGYVTQATSVPGVAQRTGSTVYYLELARVPGTGANRPAPVLAMMPVPGDVDIVIASELMETGRAILRGFVTQDRTTLIGSTHRVYAISEKSARGDGTASGARILDAAGRRARRFIGFDMSAACASTGSVISSVMFGALAGSDALPFPREAFEDAIRHGGKAVATNLAGFALGLDRARHGQYEDVTAEAPITPTTPAGRARAERITAQLPPAAQTTALEGVRRLMDYQDARYADLYLDRIEPFIALDDATGELTKMIARHLALWMAYDDTIRVADLKIRATRSARVAAEVRVAPGQLLDVTEYMHPRLQEVCETLPAPIGRFILARPALRRALSPLFQRGRHVRTTGLGWFVMLRLLAALRRTRLRSLRHAEEQRRILAWLVLVTQAAHRDHATAVEITRCQDLIKGYADTFEHGLSQFESVMAAVPSALATAAPAEVIADLHRAALEMDEPCSSAEHAGGRRRSSRH